MIVTYLRIADVVLIEPKVFGMSVVSFSKVSSSVNSKRRLAAGRFMQTITLSQ